MIATVLGIEVDVPVDGEFGAALGAARLGQIAAETCDPLDVCNPPVVAKTVRPNAKLIDAFDDAYQRFRRAYPSVRTVDP